MGFPGLAGFPGLVGFLGLVGFPGLAGFPGGDRRLRSGDKTAERRVDVYGSRFGGKA